VPNGVVLPTEMVNVEVATPFGGGVTEEGLKAAVAPVGKPEMDRLTAELKPFKDVIEMVEVLELPRTIERDKGEALMEKSGFGLTVKPMLTE